MEIEYQPTALKIPCPECGTLFSPSSTGTKVCLTCMCKNNDISSGIPKLHPLPWCRYCKRYFGTHWVLCARDSKELLGICLKKLCGLQKLKLLEANFIWSEEHSKRIFIKVKVQRDLNEKVSIQQAFKAEFKEIYTQCDDCKKEFTPHTWKALVQVRQKVPNKKTFLRLEQLLLKTELHKTAIKIEEQPFGLDFFFAQKNHAQKFLEFFDSHVPHMNKMSKELVSHDTKNATYNYKYTFYVEIPKVNKDDLVVLPARLRKENGGVNPLGVCYKVGKQIYLYDPITMKKYAINSQQYFNFESDIGIIPLKGFETRFTITDIYRDLDQAFDKNQTLANSDIKFARVEAITDQSNEILTGNTHLGHVLKHGDQAVGYDLRGLNSNVDVEGLEGQSYLPDFIFIRKFYEKQPRIWRLNRMEIEGREEPKKTKKNQSQNKQNDSQIAMEEFIDEIEQDQNMRKNFLLYKNEGVNEQDLHLEDEMVQLKELVQEMRVSAKEERFDAEQLQSLRL